MIENKTEQPSLRRQTPAEAGTVKPTGLAMRIAKRLPFGLMRLWLYFLIVFGLAGMIASAAAKKNDEQTYTIEGTLVYNPIPISAEAEGLYTAPDLKTMVSFAKSPETLQQVADELAPGTPIPLLAAMLEVIDPKTRQNIVCRLSWEDPQQGEQILARFMELFPEHMAALRKQKVLAYIQDLEQEVTNNRARLQAAQNKLSDFRDHLGTLDSATEHERLLNRYEADQQVVSRCQREMQSLTAQLAQVDKTLQELKEQDKEQIEKSKAEAAEQESLTAQRLRQNRLNELIQEERLYIQVQAKIDAKQAEFERALKLYEKDFISLANLQALEAEVRTLIAQIDENERITAWKTELTRIDMAVVPSSKTKPKSSPIITTILGKKFDLELGINGNTTTANQAMLSMAEIRKIIHRYQGLENTSVNLQKDVDVMASERDTLEAQLSSLRKLSSFGPREFSVVSGANSQMFSPSSGKKKTFIMAFGGIVFLLCAPAFVLELLKALKTRVYDQLHDMGLLDLWPMRPKRVGYLQRTVGSFTTLAEQWAQLVALRLQQLCRKPGSVLLFSPANANASDPVLVTRIAQYLALRDERVAILATTNDMKVRAAFEEAIQGMGRMSQPVERRSDPGLTAGLSEYLLHECSSMVEILRYSPTPGIDYITAGQKQTPIDLMTGSRICRVISHLQQHYTMVLVVGPEMAETIAMEIHARHCDGIVFLLEDAELLSTKMRYTLQSLQELDSERLWGMTRRPPLIHEKKPGRSSSTSLTVRILLPLLEGMYRSALSLVTGALRSRKGKVSKPGESAQKLPDELAQSIETSLTSGSTFTEAFGPASRSKHSH